MIAEQNAPVEVVAADPGVLQVEIFVPTSERIEIGPNIRFGLIDEKIAVFTQFQSGSVTTTDFTLKNGQNEIKVTAALHGDTPPYVVEFEQVASPVQPPSSRVSHQSVEFPRGKLTRVRLFELFEVQGFYGNPQQKRP